MRATSVSIAFLLVSLALAACSSGEPAEDSAETQADATVPVKPGEAAAATPAGTATVESEVTTAATGSTTADSAPPAGDLTAYVEKFPFDEVNGVSWNDHPAVAAAIRSAVTDSAARDAILTLEGPAAPIKMYQGRAGAWACQAHNCGDHQWAVLMAPDGRDADVCYHNAATTGEGSRWFLASGKQETRPGNCSVV